MLGEMVDVFAAFGPLAVLALPVMLGVLLWGSVVLARVSGVLALILPFHLIGTTILLVVLGFRVWPRYFLVDIGLISLVLVTGAFAIGQWLAARMGRSDSGLRAGMFVACLGIAASLVLLPKNYLSPKQDYEGAVAFVETSKGTAPVVALGLGNMPFQRLFAPDWFAAETAEELAALPGELAQTWIVYTFAAVVERRLETVFAMLAETHEKAKFFPGTLTGGGIVVLRPK
jgi:hypothetical protein